MTRVVLVVVDALRADHVGCYGGEDLGTPSIDRLSREGVRFSNAVSQASWTRPSVASLMTGLYPSQHGLIDRLKLTDGKLTAAGLDPVIPTLAEILAAGGYETAAFLGGNANLKPLFGMDRGFAHFAWRPTNDGSVLIKDFERWLAAERRELAFVYFHFMDVHNPLPHVTVPDRLDHGLDLDLLDKSANELRSHYATSIRKVDEHVGGLLHALESDEGWRNTWVIVTADHGEELQDHGAMLAHGRTLYSELIRVPLVMRLPAGAFGGTVVDEAVQLIDVLPTVLDYLERPAVEVTGRSLMSLIRGESVDGHRAFSELLRWDRYSQSVLTRTHHFIRSYLLEETPLASLADLKPGLHVEVKGQPIHGALFLATKVTLKEAGSGKVRATLERVDPLAGSLEALGLCIHLDDNTKLLDMDNRPFSLDELAAGERASVSFHPRPDGALVATAVMRRKHGGKSKVAGTIERVRELEDHVRVITVMGIDIAVRDSTMIRAPRQKARTGRATDHALARVLGREFIRIERELFDLQLDPAETENLATELPNLTTELEKQLDDWTGSLVPRAHIGGDDVDVDPETLEQLRVMGYVD